MVNDADTFTRAMAFSLCDDPTTKPITPTPVPANNVTDSNSPAWNQTTPSTLKEESGELTIFDIFVIVVATAIPVLILFGIIGLLIYYRMSQDAKERKER